MKAELEQKQTVEAFSDVAATCLLTLYCRALESQSKDPIIVDQVAIDIMKKLNPQLANSKDRLTRKMVRDKFDKRLWVHIALRSKFYDDTIKKFLELHPDRVVVDIGCGLDPRFPRVDNGSVIFFDLDLPEVINCKKEYMETNERYHLLAISVFEYDWMDEVQKYGKRPTIFITEGVFVYLDPEKVKDLVLTIQKQFPGSELIFEVVNKMWVSENMKKLVNFKMQKKVGLGRGTEFYFGIAPKSELESWHPGIEFLEDWSYFDTNHKKLGWMRIFRHSKFMRGTQYTVRYRLN